MGKRGVPLPVEVFWQAKQMYDELDQWGRRRFSMREVAAKLGISEMSVLRAVTNTGRFANITATPLPPTRTEQDMKNASDPIFARVWELQQRINRGEDVSEQVQKTAGQLYLEGLGKKREEPEQSARAIPPSPLDGGDAPSESDGSGLAKLVQVVGAGDAMLEELNQAVATERKKDE